MKMHLYFSLILIKRYTQFPNWSVSINSILLNFIFLKIIFLIIYNNQRKIKVPNATLPDERNTLLYRADFLILYFLYPYFSSKPWILNKVIQLEPSYVI